MLDRRKISYAGDFICSLTIFQVLVEINNNFSGRKSV